MNTNKLLSGFLSMGIRLVMIVSMLMTALMSNVSSAVAAPDLNLSSVSVAAQTGTLTYGTAGSATFSVTVSRTLSSPSSFNLSVSGLPTGATGTFSASNPVSFSGSSRTVTLTVNTLATTPAGTPTLTVTAQASGATTRTGTRTLTVAKANQTITFGSLANKTAGDPDFNVSGSASSGLAVSFSASGACTIGGTLVHITGAGSCTITASQAGNTNFNAATNVPQTFAITSSGPTTAIDLYAVTGTTTFPGLVGTVPVWGYNTTNTAATQPGGPTLVVNQNDTVSVTLHNGLAEKTGLLFQGQSMIPDTSGANAGGTKTYTFTASQPGTYLYEAGLLTHAQHQVAMGLYGVLIVRPTGAPLQAYADASTAFNAEQVLVLSEFDTVLAANPAGFDMRNYAPRYFLINGKAYPNTAPIPLTAGNNVLLRYVNAGLQSHAMSLLGFTQTVIATDGNPFLFSHKMSSETIAPGQTLDSMITAPVSVADGSKFALYDANMMMRNSTGLGTSAGLGGMLTFLTMGPPVVGLDATGPLLSSLTLSPNPSTGAVSVALAFTANDTTTGNSNVTAAEYWIDAGPHTAITVSGPASPTQNLSATIASGLSAGTHLVSVRAQDALLNWSTTATINLVVDNVGPTSSGLSLNPNPSTGAVSVLLSFSANDSTSGNSNVTSAEYWIDAGAHQPIAIASPASVVTVNATIPSGLSAGSHVIHARSQDALGNWGAEAPTINLVVDNTGPTTSSISASPNPNNGTLGLSTSVQAVRVSATFSDALSGGANISLAEGFLDVAGTTGTGFVFVANDGIFNSPVESGFADIPLAVVNTLTTGTHPVCVHAKDAAGNWGSTDCTYMLTIDRTPPTAVSITRVDASPTAATTVHFLVTFSEGVTGVTSSNFSIVRTGLTGTSTITSVSGGPTAWTVTATTGTGSGTIGLNLTSPTGITDVASNAMTSTGLPLVGQVYTIAAIVPDSIFSDGFESPTTLPGNWTSRSTTTTSRLSNTTTAALVGSRGLQAQGNNTNYVQYDFGSGSNPATGTFDARFYFNPNSNTGNNQDIYVARTTGGTTVFRVRYRWNSGTPQVQIQIGTGTGNNTWTNITNGASNRIEVVWQSGNTLQLFVGGSLVANQSLTATATSVGQFRLGSVASGGNSTLEYFDAFSAKRSIAPYGP